MVNAALAAQPSLIAKNTSQIRAKYEPNTSQMRAKLRQKRSTVGDGKKTVTTTRLVNTDHSVCHYRPRLSACLA